MHQEIRPKSKLLVIFVILHTIIRVESINQVVSAPKIVSLVAQNPTAVGSVFGDGDTITITFDVATDQAGLSANIAQTRIVVDSLFKFSQLLGTDYVGAWKSSKFFVITIIDWPGASPPTVGPGGLIVTCRTDLGRSIRADPFTVGLSVASTSVSPVMTGNFGVESVKISSITALNPTGKGDTYAAGDKLIILFNIYTNQGYTTIKGDFSLTKQQIDNMFSFSHSLGTSYSGTWDNLQQITITVQDPTGSGPPPIGIFTVTCRSTGELRNTPPACAPCTTTSPSLVGNWGPSNITIVSITAADPLNLYTVYSVNDTITILFSKDTDLAGFNLGDLLPKSAVDRLYSFSVSLGTDYTGQWLTRSIFIVTVLDLTGSGPPAIGSFTLSVKASAQLRNYPPQSAPTAALSPPLIGNWGTITPRIDAFVASGTSGIYSRGCNITITFRPPTNLANLPQNGLTKNQIDSILLFSQNLGADYSGTWIDNTMLRITAIDITGATPPVRGSLVTTCISTGPSPIRNADQISDPCFTSSGPLQGDFGPSAIQVSILASGDNDPLYSAGDSIAVIFSADSDRANVSIGVLLNKTQVDSLLSFSQNIGSAYSGKWMSNSILAINITNTIGSSPPSIGTLTVAIRAAAKLRNYPPNSAPLSPISSVLAGSFGPNNISIIALVGSDPLNADSIFSSGDKISIIFSEKTNQGGFGSAVLLKAQIDTFISFSVPLGASYQGSWSSQNVFDITAISTSGSGPPVLGIFFLTLNVTGNIRNFPPTSSPMYGTSPMLSGDFGPSPITILSFTAQDPTDLNNFYSTGDQITVVFSQITNQAGLPNVLTKKQVDFLLNFSQSLGTVYTGNWTSPSRLIITVQDITGSAPPNIGQLTVRVLQSAGLRNFPPQCKSTSIVSMPLSGNWGILFPQITALVAQDPTKSNSVYSFLDTITIFFSIPTNRAGRQVGDTVSRTDLLQLFTFSQQLGNAFTGEWVAGDKLVITIGGTSGASPPTIGGLVVSCRTDTGVLIKNELATSRPCSTASPALSGDFGPSSTIITSLVASDPTNVGGRYRNGDTITVNFNENTNQGGFPSAGQAGGILNKSIVDSIFKFSVPIGKNYVGSWVTRSQFVVQVTDITSAGPPLPGVFYLTILQSGNIRNFPPACAPSIATSPFLSGDFGPSNVSIMSWVASYPSALLTCQGYLAGSMMTITFSENTTRAGFPKNSVTKAQLDALFNFFFILGADYTGNWINDATLVITVLDTFGASPPTIGSIIGSIKASAGLKGVPPVTAGSFSTAPPMIGAFGPSNVRFVSIIARGTDSIFSNNSLIDVFFNIPTSKGFLPDKGISKSQINKLFMFSLNIGTLYSAAWISSSQLRIEFQNASRDAGNNLAYPPYVSTFRRSSSGLQLTAKLSGELRNTPALCAASNDVSPVMTGDFGPSKISIIGIEASTTVGDSVYGKDDTITIYFSENTDQAGYLASSILSKFDISGLFNFSMSLGSNYIGSWILPNMFTITCQDSTGASPPTIGGLQVTVVAGNNIRNAPPQSAPMIPVGFLDTLTLSGSFGPSDITIIAFNAYDPLDLSATYHNGNSIAIILNQHPSWKKKRVYHGQYISQKELDSMLVFSQSLGRAYQGQWVDYSICPADVYTNQPPFDGPPCVGIIVTVTDITSSTPPQIGVLQVRFLAAGDIRNDPPQSDPTTVSSQQISGTWGIPTPKIASFTAAPAFASSSLVYSVGVRFTLQFSEATNRAGLGTAWFGKTEVNKLLLFSQNLGADYRGQWTTTSTLVVEVVDSFGATPPEIGVLTVIVLSGAGRILRNAAQTSKPSTSRYVTDPNGVYGLQGSFSIPFVSVTGLLAERSQYYVDSVWGPGDSITVSFNTVVNKGCYQGCADIDLGMDYLAALFTFQDSFWSPSVPNLGSNFTGSWSSEFSEPCVRCTIGTAGVCKRNFDFSQDIKVQLMNSTCSPLAINSTQCPRGFSLCNSRTLKITNLANYSYLRPPTIGGFYLFLNRGSNQSLLNYPASAGATPQASPVLSGDFGEACVQISQLVASDPVNIDGNYGPGQETIKVIFSQDISLAAVSAGQIAGTLNNAEMDVLFELFCLQGIKCKDLAQSYTGRWITYNQLLVTINVSSSVFPFNSSADPNMIPWIGRFYLKVRNGTNMRNLPAACAAGAPVSPFLTGSFGPSNIAIVGLQVQDPMNLDDTYGIGDTISVMFSQDTDGSGNLNRQFTKDMINNMFLFSRPLGLDYVGIWITPRLFTITITQIGDIGPIDGIKCCNQSFQVRVLQAGQLRQFPPTSDATSTCGGPEVCRQIGSPVSKFWGQCTFLMQNLSNSCQKLEGNYGKPYPRIISLIGQGPSDGSTVYRSGVNITISFDQPVNLGGCSSADELNPDVLCNVSLGTCSLQIQPSNTMLNCTNQNGMWIPGNGFTRGNCQLIFVNTSNDCAKRGGRWSPGLAPFQACSDGSNLSLSACIGQNKNWTIFETIIPKYLVDLAIKFSDMLGTNYFGRWSNITLSCVLNSKILPCSQKLVLDIVNASLAGPPEMDLFYLRLSTSQGIAIRSAIMESPGSTAISPNLTGSFGPFKLSIVYFAAGPPVNSVQISGLYQDGVSLLIGFNTFTNRANMQYSGNSKSVVDKFLVFDKSIGSNYSGFWTNCTKFPGKIWNGCQLFVINISNALGASPPTVKGLKATINQSANLRNYPASCEPAIGFSDSISGDWGPSPIKISKLIASNTNSTYPGFQSGSAITVLFNMDTDRGGMPQLYPLGINAVRQIFDFLPYSLAKNYTGFWLDNKTFVINISDIDPSPNIPYIGSFFAVLLPGANIRNYPPTCATSTGMSPALSGGFGRSVIYIASIVASPGGNVGDDTSFSDNDTITITFNRGTNQGVTTTSVLTKAQVDAIFNFSSPIGSNYIGLWVNNNTFKITILNSTQTSRFWCEAKPECSNITLCTQCAKFSNYLECVKHLPDSQSPDFILNINTPDCPDCSHPVVLSNKSTIENNGSAMCRYCPRPLFNWQVQGICSYKSDSGINPPLIDSFSVSVYLSAGLREFPPVTEPTTGIDTSGIESLAVLTGGFCPSPIKIDMLVARDTKNYDSVFSAGDEITIIFNQDTNKANLPSSGLQKSQIDNLFNFSCLLGANYTGAWLDSREFRIVIEDVSGNGSPRIGQFYVTTRKDGNLRNFPPVCGQTSVSGNKSNPVVFLSNNFGPSSIYIKSFIASAQDDLSEHYRIGVMFTVQFSESTNRGNLPSTNISKRQIDNLLGFNSNAFPILHPLGQDYVGSWSSDNITLSITLLSINGSEFSTFGAPEPAGLGLFFRVSVKASGDLRNSVYQSSPTVIDDSTQALNKYQNPNNAGLDCDCCRSCGACSVCSITKCMSVIGSDGILVDVCSLCCHEKQTCCRVLKGNYGIVVAITNVYPKSIPTSGMRITIVGKGIDPLAAKNKVFVGGVLCPIVGVYVEVLSKLGNLTCISPGGIGPDLKPVQLQVVNDVSGLTIAASCCSKLVGSVYTISTGGVIFKPPEVTSVIPTKIMYSQDQKLTIFGLNFGSTALFDKSGKYIGPVGTIPQSHYVRPTAFVVIEGGAYLRCTKTNHITDTSLVCTTPEVTAMRFSAVVNVAGQVSRSWVTGSLVQVLSLPNYSYECPVEATGRCYDCCEVLCLQQQEEEIQMGVTDEFQFGDNICQKKCFMFCGFA